MSAATVCALWMRLGMVHVSHSHPDLLDAIDGGVALAEFDYAGRRAVECGKGFGYALGIVKSRLAEKARPVVGRGGVKNFDGADDEINARFAEQYPWLCDAGA
ncbi:hypothetical protein [Methylomonas sp. CM2]|uniref:hypothetical protein n=1 Tax=Methylomonas sp. CM2 TaxID=3417647 RepID=UPI003CEDA2B0